jgi:filamentous hemagglutinin
MNRRCYRLVFNRARGLLMAVAETTPSHSAAGSGPRLFTGSVLAGLLSLTPPLILTPTLLPITADAQIISDAAAPAHHQAIVTSAANGVPLVQIQTPTAGGVSRNVFTQFDVQSNGAILNNANQSVQTALGGWVQANPMLDRQASVIVNEVNSSHPSLLHGYAEVAGQRAQVIIANPSGISCDGCGFINASRATLTTGVPHYSASGNLDHYLVRRGTVSFSGHGLDSRSADYTDVLARAVQVNAALHAHQLNVIAGSNEVRASDLQTTAMASGDGKPTFAIDVSELGGMYAGKIWLVGTEAGVGVRHAGMLGGGGNDLRITAAGRLEVTDVIDSTDRLDVNAAQGLTNRGTLHAAGDASLQIAGELDNTGGVIAAGGVLSITDAAFAERTLRMTNTDGMLIAGRLLSIDAASLSGDGKVLSGTDVDIRLTTDYNHVGELAANRNLTLRTTGTVNNQAAMVAGEVLAVTADKLNNETDGSLEAQTIRLQATAPHALINRGLINGGDVLLKSTTIKNLGTGRIYGDQVALDADIVINDTDDAAGSAAPVIAARSRLDIGADQITNREGALLYSDGELSVGRHLDAQLHAVGQARRLDNLSANIEAAGDMRLAVDEIRNINMHYRTRRETTRNEPIVEVAGSGTSKSYTPDAPDVYIYMNESHHLHTPEGNYERWRRYQYQRTVTEDVTDTSTPAKIIAGGNLRVRGETLTNDKSRIVAGQALDVQVATLNNIDATGTRTTTDVGTVDSFWRDREKGVDKTGTSEARHEPTPQVQSISLGVVGYEGQTPQSPTRVVDIANGSGQSTRNVSLATTVPSNSLYRTAPEVRGYVVETDPRFTDYKQWLGSDYLLQQLALDPQQMQKRLGDGFYEQRLVREQIAQLTGRRFLPGYTNDEAQFQALMDKATTFAQAHQLRPGIALSAAQMAVLTSDIVWLVEKDITLPNGQVTRALVPQVYVQVRNGDLSPDGALLGGDQVKLSLTGDLTNGGTIAGWQLANLSAAHINNLGGSITGGSVKLNAAQDINNLGGQIQAEDALVLNAGNDITMASTTRSDSNAQGSHTNIDRVAGLYVRRDDGQMVVAAGHNLTLKGASVQQGTPAASDTNKATNASTNTTSNTASKTDSIADSNAAATAISTSASTSASTAAATLSPATGRVVLAAGHDVHLDTVTVAQSETVNWGGGNHRHESSQSEVASTIKATGNIDIVAGRDIITRGAQVATRDGDIQLNATRDVTLGTAESRVSVDESHRHTRRGFLSSTTTRSRDTLDQTTQQGSLLSGNRVSVQSGQDIAVTGSAIASTNGTVLDATRNISIEAATNTRHETQLQQKQTSGLMSSGGFGVTIGKRNLKTNSDTTTTTASASTIGSTQGDVRIKAGDTLTQTGSHIITPQGDVSIAARKVDIVEARNSETTVTDTQFRQIGLTVAVSNPIVTAVQTAKAMSEAASNTTDSRMKALAAANTAMAAKNAVDAVMAGQGNTINGQPNQISTGKDAAGKVTSRDTNAVDKLGGLQLSISLGKAKSDSRTVVRNSEAVASTVGAGGDVTITALGDQAHSDITLQGSQIAAGQQVKLIAEHALKLKAASNTQTQTSSNSNSSRSLGVILDSKGGFGVNASASRGLGKADGQDQRWTNAEINSGQNVALQSGADITMKGGIVFAPQVTVAAGGKLDFESLQDSSTYTSRQKQLGGSATIGTAPSGNLNYAKSNIDSTYNSVTEQSGIRAGDGGFDVKVTGDTTLKGGVISSTQAAIDANRNSFTTDGQVSTTHIDNRAHYQAESVSVNLGTGFSAQGKLAPTGTGVGFGKDSDNAASTTQAGISGVAGDASLRTGDKATGIAKIFDADKVQKELIAQTQITQEFSSRANKMVVEYVESQQKALHKALEDAPSEEAKRQIKQQQSDLRKTEHAFNILIGAVTSVAGTAVTKEALSVAAGKMRDLMIEDSQKFRGITDGKTTITNMSGRSKGVRHDEIKLGGTRMDLDALCGEDYQRCDATKVDGKRAVTLNDAGLVVFKEDGAGMSLEKFLQTKEGKKLEGLTGGIQGAKGTLFGIPYMAGSWQDQLIESFAGTHDVIGGKLSGLYDTHGNIVQGLSGEKRFLYDRWADVAVIPSAPFALAERLSPALWQAISIVLKEAK